MSSPKTPSCATVGLYSAGPLALDAFHAFDPESFSLIPLLNDGLISIGLDGDVQPALAVSWSQVSPLQVVFELRRGVYFSNGDLLTSADVVATFAAHRGPTPSACGGGILSPITDVVALGESTVRVTTAFPDAMLLRRLFFSQIYPRSVLDTAGRDAFSERPVGTGAYELVHWRRGEEILLRRNPNHWACTASIDELRFPIVRQKEWVARLKAGDLDIALNVDSHQVVSAERIEGLTTVTRDAALSQWFLLSNKGPLADARVRRALNHAINQSLLVDITEHGRAKIQRTIATAQQEGFNPDVDGYRYSPELARALLAEAGFAEGFTLRGLVSETSTALYLTARELLGRVGVHLEAEIVPRAEWLGRVVVSRMSGQGAYDGDFAVASVDNPTLHSLFHQFIFLYSEGPFSLTRDADYDRAFLAAATEVDPTRAFIAQRALEQYARDEALLLFTVQQQAHVVARKGFSVKLPRSGHFGAAAICSLVRAPDAVSAGAWVPPPRVGGDMGRLLEATSHLGLFHMEGSPGLGDPVLNAIWRNVEASEDRWHLQMEPMVRELVSLSDARTNLDNVLDSTDRVAIVGVSPEGAQVFSNSGYVSMFGPVCGCVTSFLGQVAGQPTWDTLKAEVARRGSWAGPVVLPTRSRPIGAAPKLYLTVTSGEDAEGNTVGHTLVFSDFSGEEERIKSRAVRTILDHATDGLFRCDREGRVMEGYSKSCATLLRLGEDMEGERLVDVLRLSGVDADYFVVCYEQVIEDALPEEVTLDQLARRVDLRGAVISLSGSAIRDEAGEIASILMTVVDITGFIEAERDAQRLEGIVRVLRFKDRFSEFVHRFLAGLAELPGTEDETGRTRAALHNAKGVFGLFGLHDIAALIHRIEDCQVVGRSQVREVSDAVVALLAAHHDVWGLSVGDQAHRLSTSAVDVVAFERAVAEADTVQGVRAIATRFAHELRRRPVTEMIGPLAESARLHGLERGRAVQLLVRGADYRVPAHLSPVFDSLPQLVHNAIDHGIEDHGKRGGKPEIATLRLCVLEDAQGLRVSLADDGKGIDADVVSERAVALGVISATQRDAMSTDARCALIFTEGLSTARSVSKTSGRGIGMAAVRRAVAEAGGSISIETTRDVGTTITFAFPSRSLGAPTDRAA